MDGLQEIEKTLNDIVGRRTKEDVHKVLGRLREVLDELDELFGIEVVEPVITRTESQGTKECPACHEQFIPKRDSQTYCSNKCRLSSYPGNKRPEIELVKKTEEQEERIDTFVDPWNCAMCCNAQSLCQLHEKMEIDGQKPPKFRLTV